VPVHDWSRVDHGVFHYFHQAWTIEISYALNGGVLPKGFFAMAEQGIAGPIPDVVTLQRHSRSFERAEEDGGLAVAEVPPHAAYITSAELEPYAARANRIVVKHRMGRVVAVIEVVSPGNKSNVHGMRSFVDKAYELMEQGVHLLVVDLFPPTPRDPQGIHKAIWDTIRDEPFELPAGKPLTIAAYYAGVPKTAYVDPIAIGDSLPSSPLFLDEGIYVPAPLESTYQTTWQKCPDVMREDVEESA
jgi:hypothetical protein